MHLLVPKHALYYLSILFILYFFISCSSDFDTFRDAVFSESINNGNQVADIDVENSRTDNGEDSEANPPEDENLTESRISTFLPLHDTFIQDGIGYNQEIVRLEEAKRTTYLMFDLSPIDSIQGVISGIVLQFTITKDDGGGNIIISKGDSSNWDENEIIAATAPKNSGELASIIKDYPMNSTELIYLSAEELTPGYLTLILEHKNGDDLAFASKEHPQDIGPRLIVNYDVPLGSEELVIPSESSPNSDIQKLVAIADGSPNIGKFPLTVSFTGSNSYGDSPVATFAWDFQDGNNSTMPDPEHTFTEVGTYLVELTITDEEGLKNTDQITIEVTEEENQPPSAVLSASEETGLAPLQIVFDGSASTDDQEITSYLWDFGDGNSSTEIKPTHVFEEPGSYTVELTVLDKNGISDREQIEITVLEQENNPPTAEISADPISGTAPLTVQFTGSNSTDDNEITSFYWDFMDGTTSSEINPTHTFVNSGNYNVALMVTDSDGLKTSTDIMINVSSPSNGNAPDGSYYVTTNGSATNDGLSENSAWSIEYAFEQAKAGDHVYIKAGNYGNVRLQPANQGTASSPIRFIGYKNVPGDIQAVNGSTFNYGDNLDSNRMPLIKGERINNEGQGTGIFNFMSYIEISNIQITHYNEGLFSSGEHNVFDNIIATEIGDFNPAHTYPENTSNPFLNYAGIGIKVGGDFSVIKNCFVLNAGAEGFRFAGCKFQQHSNNKVYSDSTINPCDYYYLITSNAYDNEISNVYVERVGDLQHAGHGIVLKFDAKRNIIRNSTVKNTWLELSYSEVSDNEFYNCSVIGGTNKQGALLIANGAHHNVFNNCEVKNNDGVCFSDWDEDFSRGDVNNAGHHNTFIQCTFDGNLAGVNFYWFSQENTDSEANDNTFDQCTFSNMENLFMIDRANRNTVIKNSTMRNISNLKDWFRPTIHSHLQLDAYFSNNILENCGFTID